MQRGNASTLFLILVAGAALFVWMTSLSLPALVASHFGVSGIANGFMPRAFYTEFMLVFVVALPLMLVVLPNQMFSSPHVRLNLPNREYWLAPNRRSDTIAFLRQHSTHFGAILVIFLCYVHWLVVRANAVQPPTLSSLWFIVGLVVFLIANLIWVVALFDRFRLPR